MSWHQTPITPKKYTAEDILSDFSEADEFITKSEYYSKSGEGAEIDDMYRYMRGELDYRERYQVDIINTYCDMSEKEMLTHMADLYEFLFKERMKELKERIQTLE